MALALYRKYRPRTFAEVIGQEQVTEPLMQALRSGRLNHAYLFSGPRGCGKTSSARILARSLNCEHGPTPEPCGECESCRALAPDGPGSIDVIEIDAASHGGVDDARDLREKAFFAPISSRYKVYVIDEAHMVSPQGFNALLKLVEEPPDFVKFVFATTEPEKVLGTIKSRTHHYPFRLIPPGVLRPFLEKMCEQEGVRVEPAVFPLVVRAGGGSVRDSLSVLDQLIGGADERGVTYARAVGLLGVTDIGLIDEMADALAAGDGAAAFATIERVSDAGHDPRRYASDLLERFRDLIILQRVPDAVATGLIDAPADQLERMATQASRLGQATLSRLADIAHNGLTEMRGTTAPRLLLELIVARMLLPAADDGQSALLQRLERMERRLGAASTVEDRPVRVEPAAPSPAAPLPAAPPPAAPAPVAAEPAPTPAPSPAPAEAQQRAPGELDSAAVRRVWDEVLGMVRRRSARASALIREAVVRDVNGNEIVLVFRHAAHANMFPAHSEMLAEAVHEVLGGTWRLRAEMGGDGRPEPSRSGRPSDPAPAAGPGRPSAGDRGPARGAAGASGGRASDDNGWPEPARPGGDARAAAAAGPQQRAGGAAPARAAGGAPQRASEGATSPSRAGGTPQRGGTTPPRPAAQRPSSPQRADAAGRSAPRPSSAGPAPAARPTDDEEPPWDREYEPAEYVPTYEGFDPGDEPLDDDAQPNLPIASPEDRAIQLLSEQLGAERVSDP